MEPVALTAASAPEIARIALDDGRTGEEREAALRARQELLPAVVAAMTRDLPAGTPEEYRRIPWIWRASIAVGRRNEADALRELLDVALPAAGAPLRDWQAVVLGGGIVNGLSLDGVWPAERIREIVGADASLGARWEKALEEASVMAHATEVPVGTRYDALRMIALDDWERRGVTLLFYIVPGANDELQMGAISGLSDVRRPSVAALLIENLAHFSEGNRKLALDALLRTPERAAALLDALAAGVLKREILDGDRRRRLTEHPDESIRTRARATEL